MLQGTDATLQDPLSEAEEAGVQGAATNQSGRRKGSTATTIAKAALVLMAGTILSRILGLGRETTIAFLFGRGADVDAFTIANNVATIVYDLLISGTVSAALVPVFSEYAADEEQRPEFARVVSTILSVAGAFLIASVVVLELFAAPLVGYMGSDLPADARSLALTMTQWVLPGVVFMGMSGVVMAAHYSLGRFVYPAFTSALFNASIIFCAFTLAGALGVKSLALGLVVGAFAMLALQAPGLRDIPLRLRLDIHHPAVKRILKLYAPVGISVIISSAALVVDRNLASQTGEGSISAMRFATTIVQFALGMVSAAISLASLPSLSKHFSKGDWEAYRRTLGTGLRLVMVLVLPAAAALLALASPIVGLLFTHGQFKAADQNVTALALLFYVPGLPFGAVDQVLIFAFYARKNTITPVLVGIAAVGIYLAVALGTYKTMGMPGLVLANSVQYVFHALVTGALLWRVLRREGGGDADLGITGTLMKSIGAAGALALVSYASWWLLDRFVYGNNVVVQAILLGVPAALGAATYVGLLWWLRVPELQMVLGRVTSRLGKLRRG